MEDKGVLERILNREEEPKDLPLPLLEKITNHFSEEGKIGQGGFGEVYMGDLGNNIVAVKRMYVNEHTVDDKAFRREIKSLMNTNHQNVVRFLGFCSHTHHKIIKETGSAELNFVKVNERLLCSEYICNGSLDKFIQDELRGLQWETRYDIITGICKGLNHLKERNIIHMDLKPSNILLDRHMVPKITDFGLSRPNNNSHTVGLCFGTLGYFAPEYLNDGKTSLQCDIYSLGVIITEIVTGCRGVPDNNDIILRRWRHRWKKPPTLLQYQQVTRCINIAVRCREQIPEARPSMGDIVSILGEPESTDRHTGQESTYLDDDMLGIEPLELHFTFKRNNEMSCLVKLTNQTKDCFAFDIESPSKQYTTRPDKGIVPPGCNEYFVHITVQPEDCVPQATQNDNKFIVWSRKVAKDLRVEDITEHMFRPEAGKVIDEVDLMVVYGPISLKRGRDPNVLVEAVSPEAINSSSYKDGAQTQCTNQLDRRNFHSPENFSRSQPTNMTYLWRVSDRAVDVTRGAMGSLLHKLGELLKEEFNLETSFKEDVKSLSDELMMMQPVLRKLSEVQQENLDDLVKRWDINVREMSYDLEDFVDGFLVHNEPDSNRSKLRELTHEMCFLLDKGKNHHTIDDLIKDKRKQVQHEAKRRKEYNVDDVVALAAATVTDGIDPRMLVVFQRPMELVGIEEPRDNLIKRLTQVSEQQLRIFSIYGAGGLGKTTLAKAVYHKLEGQFHPMAFVSVGRNPNKKQVLRDIIDELYNDSNTKDLNKKQLIKELHKLLKNKRYFIVIDDIWDSPTWGIIQYAFPENSLGSRVVTTTRIHSVADACCTSSNYVWKMQILNHQDSRKLFVSRIFGMEDVCPDVPEDILTVILKKCGGLPLAIISIASLVAKDPRRRSTWDYVQKSLIGMFEGDNPTLADMEQILDLSYRHLPDHLKTCLLHVCMYPEDYEIYKNDLTRKWVAEGFVVSTNGRLDAEDVAETYFKELINMCMIQPGTIDNYSNEVLSCTVHDIILDLMRSKSTDENFIHVIDGSKDKTSVHREIRRISVHGNNEEDNSIFEKINGSLLHARSAILYKVALVPYLLAFKYVRVLHIEHPRAECRYIDLTSITGLFLLRYLKIKNYFGRLKLPGQIGELQQLETIDVGEAGSLETHPSDIGSLKWLSHLKYDTYNGPGMALPEGVERLKLLRTLEGVHLYESLPENIKGIGKLTSLRKLQIFLEDFKQSEEEANAMRMNALQSSISMISASLRILTLGREELEDYRDYRDYILDVPRGWSSKALFREGSAIVELDLGCCRFESCPEWISQLCNLQKFSVTVREVADGLSIVAWLPSLSYFSLDIRFDDLEEKEESVVIPGGGSFKALKYLNYGCPMAALTFEAGAMPKLEKLDLALEKLPVGIQHLPAPTLNKINLFLDNADLYEYTDSDLCTEKHKRKLWAMLKKAFKQHHPGASIDVYFGCYHLDYSDDECYSTEEDDEPAYQVNGQLVELIELWKDSGGMSINTNAPPLVAIGSEGSQSGRGEEFCEDDDKEDMFPFGTSPLRKVGTKGRQSGHREGFSVLESLQPPFIRPVAPLHLTLALAAPLHGSPPTANLPVSTNNDLSFQRGNSDMLLNGGDYYCCEEVDEAAYQGNESQASAQGQAKTRQLAQQIELQQDYRRMSTETDMAPVVDTSLHLAVESEERQSRRGHIS